jgi:hypothetical protein
MTTWTALGRAVAVGAIVLCSAAAAFGEPADPCSVPGYLLFGDSKLDRVHAAVEKEKALRIAVLGGTSSSLPGPDGVNAAYPARLEAALGRRLPGIKVTVGVVSRPRQTAEQMAESINQLLDQKPSLVVWQTGTYDAVRGTDPEEFRAAVSDGVEKIKEAGADVVLVNMQYSPRTENIMHIGAYADAMRWVSREREVPVFDRLAIMRHWYDQGQFDLYKATKDLKMAKSVHDCLGRALGATIIDAAHLEAWQGASPQQ